MPKATKVRPSGQTVEDVLFCDALVTAELFTPEGKVVIGPYIKESDALEVISTLFHTNPMIYGFELINPKRNEKYLGFVDNDAAGCHPQR